MNDVIKVSEEKKEIFNKDQCISTEDSSVIYAPDQLFNFPTWLLMFIFRVNNGQQVC